MAPESRFAGKMPVKLVREFMFHEVLDASSTKALGPSDDEKANCFSSRLLGIRPSGTCPSSCAATAVGWEWWSFTAETQAVLRSGFSSNELLGAGRAGRPLLQGL